MTAFTVYITDQKSSSTDFIRRCASDFTGISCAEAEIQREPMGKPYFSDRSLPCFSLSHSGIFTACAVGTSPCGIDVQEHVFHGKPRDTAYLLRLANRFFHNEEACFLRHIAGSGCIESPPFCSPGDEVSDVFFRIWSAKESIVKYTGDGIRDFSAFSVLDLSCPFFRMIPVQRDYSLFLSAGTEFSYKTKRI